MTDLLFFFLDVKIELCYKYYLETRSYSQEVDAVRRSAHRKHFRLLSGK